MTDRAEEALAAVDWARGRADIDSRRIGWAGFGPGLGDGVVCAHTGLPQPGGASQVLALGADVITAPLLAAAYGTAGLRLAIGCHARVTTSALAPAGRMTLINYLAQPLVGTLMFTGYGTAFVGRVAPVWVAMITLTLFVLRTT
ncbi:DUF418 domain-containing protein [Streptomyces sp. NPDC059455]|uniref:DUF418 domain-containing protein n=1 Tax=Streptomyces sp. NPDC059455 TaxID=3346837 RepID=UPI0036AB6D9D